MFSWRPKKRQVRGPIVSQFPVWVCLLPFSSERFVSSEAGASVCPISQGQTIVRSAPMCGGKQHGDGGKQSELPLRLSRSHNRLGDETLENRTEFVKRNAKTVIRFECVPSKKKPFTKQKSQFSATAFYFGLQSKRKVLNTCSIDTRTTDKCGVDSNKMHREGMQYPKPCFRDPQFAVVAGDELWPYPMFPPSPLRNSCHRRRRHVHGATC